MPLNTKIGGEVRLDKHKYRENRYLTEDQARNVCKKVELGDIINISTMKQVIDQDQELNRLDDMGRDINPYRELIVNNTEKTDTVLTHMQQWSILSNIVNYVQYDRHQKNFYNLNVRAVNKEKYKRKSITEKERQMYN